MVRKKFASLHHRCLGLLALALALLPTLVETLQFAKSHDTAVVPIDFPTKTPFYETHVLASATVESGRPEFFLSSASPAGFIELGPMASGRGVQLYLINALHDTDMTEAPAVVLCARAINVQSTPCVNVTVLVLPAATDACRTNFATTLCFGSPTSLDAPLHLPEQGAVPQPVVSLQQPVFGRLCRHLVPVYNYTSLLGRTDRTLSVENGTLVLKERLNADEIVDFTFELGCNVTTEDGVRHRLRKSVVARLNYVNDLGPQPSEGSTIVINNTKDFTYKILSVRDHDARPSPYRVELFNDSLQLFSLAVNQKKFYSGLHAWIITATVRPKLPGPLDFTANSYTIAVRFVDTTLMVAPNTNHSNQVVYTLTFAKGDNAQPANPSILNALSGGEFNATVAANAAISSRVAQPIDPNQTLHAGVLFYLEATTWTSQLPFNVTPSEGIVYVNDTVGLSQLDSLTFRLMWRARFLEDPSAGHLSINVQVISPEDSQSAAKGNLSCERSFERDGIMCSMSASMDACQASCGPGASSGRCLWRVAATLYSYATCTPDLRTCPDKVCDELERTFYYICPQDCVEADEVHGAHFTRGQSHGISNGHGTCTCDAFRKCSCDVSALEGVDPEDEVVDADTSGSSSHLATVNKKGRAKDSLSNHDDLHMGDARTRSVHVKEKPCGLGCIVTIGLSTGLVIVGAVGCFCLVRRRRRRRKCATQRGLHKYPNRDSSAPAVPSDYVVDERSSSSSSAVASQNIVLQDILSIANKNMQAIESEWEFPRYRLLLEQTLGEGEFGRVMRAKALDINGQPGYTTVAVKMSKCVGSSAELDLLQEFNLLKEVVHPNVIRVLGACSSCKDGPLFIIVEYAEFGSLRVYLRKSRRLEFKSCTSDDSGVDSLANGGGTLMQVAADHPPSDYQVNPRDLLQFAWQIAKGMAYLGEMKLVHRDLASRNILVAAGKVVKISDFGLTRDVYEGDAYFKKSTGRVPVKWMAIESLSDHVYTTKSDVWSFGIVLWEIITLGAAPYPGVPPEALYRLLKSGYRMEKPDNCAEELYGIMKKCWNEFPHERPSFVELTSKFDDMLQANVEYLDLGVNMVHNMTYFEDTTGQTETVDDSEMGYGSWNALPTDDGSDYLQSNCRSSNVEDEEIAFLLKERAGSRPAEPDLV